MQPDVRRSASLMDMVVAEDSLLLATDFEIMIKTCEVRPRRLVRLRFASMKQPDDEGWTLCWAPS